MPNVNPIGVGVAPGQTNPNSFPEWGVGGGTPGSSAGWKIVRADNAQEKMALAQQGYLIWFNSKSAAQNEVSSESSAYGSGNPPNPLGPLAEIGDFFHRLTEGSTWVRVGEVALGGILLYAAVRAMAHGSTVAGSGARSTVTKPVKKVAKAAATVAVPEARLASRVAAKRIAPKTTAKVASHRQRVAKYGAKKPYQAPAAKPPSPPRVTVRHSHIYHHNLSPAAKPKPKAKPIKKSSFSVSSKKVGP